MPSDRAKSLAVPVGTTASGRSARRRDLGGGSDRAVAAGHDHALGSGLGGRLRLAHVVNRDLRAGRAQAAGDAVRPRPGSVVDHEGEPHPRESAHTLPIVRADPLQPDVSIPTTWPPPRVPPRLADS